MFAGPQAQNGFTLTKNKMKLDAVFLVVLGVDDFEFFFLRYLFLFQRYSSFPIMQIWSLMTSSAVEVQ